MLSQARSRRKLKSGGMLLASLFCRPMISR
jgi:hypothetical protein